MLFSFSDAHINTYRVLGAVGVGTGLLSAAGGLTWKYWGESNQAPRAEVTLGAANLNTTVRF